MATDKQLKANRINAQKGGVKTPDGKEISKMNALKHGILSNEILLDGDFQENPSEFEEIRNDVCKTYKPEGIIEEFYIQRIICGIWRMKRAIKAEKGVIQSFTNSFISEKELKRELATKDIYDKIPTICEALVEANPKLIQRAIELFQFAKNEYEKLGSLSETNHNRITDYFSRDKNYWANEELSEANYRLNSNIENSLFSDSSEEEKMNAKIVIRDYLNNEINKLQKCLVEAEKQTNNQDTANLYSMLIPNQFDSERLQRYETSIENQIYKAIDELLKHQSLRKDKNI